MSTEERDESQPRPRKIIPSIRRKTQTRKVKEDLTIRVTTDLREITMNVEPYNRPERDDRGGYRSYDNRPSYGENRNSYGNNDRPSRPTRPYGDRDGGNARPSYGKNRPSYGNREGGYNKPSYGNRPSYGKNQTPLLW